MGDGGLVAEASLETGGDLSDEEQDWADQILGTGKRPPRARPPDDGRHR